MTHPQQHDDPVAPLLAMPPATAGRGLRMRLGVVVTWGWSPGPDKFILQATVNVGGEVIEDVPILCGPYSLTPSDGFLPGTVVVMLSDTDDYGTSTNVIIGISTFAG